MGQIIVNLDVEMAKRKISLGELAERIGLTQANLSILKTGKARAVRFTTLEAICRELGCQPGDIAGIGSELSHYLLRPCQCEVNVVADVLLADDALEVVAFENRLDLLVDTREDNGDTLLLTHQTHILEVMQTRGVDERNLTHSDDTHLRMFTITSHDILETVAGTEEVRTVDLIHLHVLRNGEVLQVATLHIRILVEVDLIQYGMHVRRLSHPSHKQQTGTDESELDGNGEVEDDGKEEGEQQDGDVALRITQHRQGKNAIHSCHRLRQPVHRQGMPSEYTVPTA